MTGKEWDAYFKTLSQDKKEELRKALLIIGSDPMMRKAYGTDFDELVGILDFPFNLTY